MLGVFDKYRQYCPEVMAKDKIPGLSIALVDSEGILWTAGFGRTGDRGRPVTPDTLFSIGSTSKTFTATAMMIAVQDGLLDLDTPIAEYLPDFTVNSRFEERPHDKMTLRHLLTHTAGFTLEAPFGGNLADIRYGSLEDHVLSIQQTWLKFRVGERWSYSNPGMNLAAYILQVQSGLSFEQYMKEKVFDPLGMPNSSLDYGLVKGHPHRARGHSTNVSEFPVITSLAGSGGVHTTARDMSRFVRFHLNRGTLDGQTILEPRLLDAMCTTSTISSLTSSKKKYQYGLCVLLREKHDSYSVCTGGDGYGFRSWMMWYPEYGIGCIALTNSQAHDKQNRKITDAILDRLITQKVVTKDTSGAVPTADQLIGKDTRLSELPEAEVVHTPTPFRPEWKRYVGTYRLRPGPYKFRPLFRLALALGACADNAKVTVEEKDGLLWVKPAAQGRPEPLEEHEPGLFFTPAGEALDFRGPVPTWGNLKIDAPWLLWSI
jgi:CubicO group peptidase (beta-lactamase class C family)